MKDFDINYGVRGESYFEMLYAPCVASASVGLGDPTDKIVYAIGLVQVHSLVQLRDVLVVVIVTDKGRNEGVDVGHDVINRLGGQQPR